MPTYYHLKEIDYPVNFPNALDIVPIMIQKRIYLDDWIFNRMYAIILNIQDYLILHKATIEA